MATRIFVIEDNAANLKPASNVLEMEGYTVVKAVNAEEAQEMLKHTTPDLILMDITLPEINGLTRSLLSHAHRGNGE
jgi:CheY-like chemotaxis protein